MNRESIIAIIRIVVPAVCAVLGVLGWTIDSENITNVAVILAGGIISLYTGYYNNNVTAAAQAGQKVTDKIKDGLAVPEEYTEDGDEDDA